MVSLARHQGEALIVSSAAVDDLNTLLATGIPDFVVAYFAARAMPDNFAERDEPPTLKVPKAWRDGWRRWLVDC
jgi:hypothetical protein